MIQDGLYIVQWCSAYPLVLARLKEGKWLREYTDGSWVEGPHTNDDGWFINEPHWIGQRVGD